MPNRIIRDGILSSETVCSLSWAEEILYRRLMSIVDDYGRMEANTQYVRSRCYPLQVDKVSTRNVEQWMQSLVTSGLILVYEVENKTYLQILKFGQQTRSKSKCPEPSDSNCRQMISNDRNGNHLHTLSVSVSEGVVEGEGECVSCDDRPSPASPKKEKSKFAASRPESRDECVAHCRENLGLTENDGIALWEHWQGNGFRNKGSPMASWRHTASNWARRRIFFPSLQDRKP